MRVLIVNNLNSGLRNGAIFDFVRTFSDDGDEVVIRSTDGNTRIEDFLGDAKSFDLVVAAGGDGTIAAVCYELRYSGIPILPFPAGTGNLLATNLDQPEEPFAIARMARALKSAEYDLGEISFEGVEGPTTRGFVIIGGAGFDATIMESSERLKESLGPMAYVAAALANPSPALARFTITLDDRVVDAEGIAVLLLNFARIYPDISITHANDARDGLFEVVVLKQHNTVELLPAFIAAFLDREGKFPGRTNALEVYTTSTATVESNPPLRIQFDGESANVCTPLRARILPFATRLVVTDEEAKRVLNLAE
jgi:diacylglycerol kinase family enzyme